MLFPIAYVFSLFMEGNYNFISFIDTLIKHFLSIMLLFSRLSSSLIKVSLRLKMTKVISYVFVTAYKCELFFYSRDADYFALFYRINLKVYSAFFSPYHQLTTMKKRHFIQFTKNPSSKLQQFCRNNVLFVVIINFVFSFGFITSQVRIMFIKTAIIIFKFEKMKSRLP